VRQRGVHGGRLVGALVAAVLVVGLAAPAGAQETGPDDEGALKVATDLPAPGFWNGTTLADLDGGFEYELAQEIADRLGYGAVEHSNVSFDALVTGEAKGFDLALSQVTITKERKKVVDFSGPYFSFDQGVLVKTGTTVDQSNIEDVQWGVQAVTTAQTFLAKKVKPDEKPRAFQEASQMFAALQAGEVDAVLLDTAIVLVQAQQSGGELEVVGQFETGESYGAVFPQGSKLRRRVSRVLKEMEADGTLAALGDEWLVPEFGVNPQKIPYFEP